MHPSQLPATSGEWRHIRPTSIDIPYWRTDGELDTVTTDGYAVYQGDQLIGTAWTPDGALQLLHFSPSPDRRGQGSTAKGGEPPAPPASDGQAPPQIYDGPFHGLLCGLAFCAIAACCAAWVTLLGTVVWHVGEAAVRAVFG